MSCSDLRAARLAALFALVLGAALLAACQPLPRPFAKEGGNNPLVELPQSAGIVVEEIAGLPPPLAREYRDAVIAALQEAKILASAGPGNRGSFHLRGAGATAPEAAARGYVTWELTDAGGRQLAAFPSTARLRPGAIARDNPGTLENIVRRVAESLEVSRAAAQAPEGAARTHLPVTVLPVEGAPGDGREALQRALGLALRERGVRVVSDGVDADGVLVYGDVAVAAVPPNRERVDIVWSVRWPDGRELGRVTQSNTIAAGLLNQRWGQIALAAADGAADGIAVLVKNAVRDGGTAPATAAAAPANPVYTPGRR